jgi:dTDP-4-dehydrorhamnose reductase
MDPAFHIAADIGDFPTVYSKITAVNPDVIVHTAAMTGVDDCQRNPQAAYRINALGARNVAEAARRFDAYLISISTDYVFGATPPESPDGYDEMETPSPSNEYGKSKLWGEYLTRTSGAKHCIVRTSWVFGSRRANYVSAAADAGRDVFAAADMTACPTYATDLAEAVRTLAESSAAGPARTGVFHLTNQGAASRYEIAIFVAETLGLPVKRVKKTTIAALGLPAVRPSYSALKNRLWPAEGFKPLRPWREAVADYLADVTEKREA